jgi:hypothetical protein
MEGWINPKYADMIDEYQLKNERVIAEYGGPKLRSRSFGSVRATRHLLKRPPKTYPRLGGNKMLKVYDLEEGYLVRILMPGLPGEGIIHVPSLVRHRCW